MRKHDLEETMKFKPRGYRLEVVMNKYLMQYHKKVVWTESSIRNIHKVEKWGLWEGMKRSVGMEIDLFIFLGPLEYFEQVIFIAREELK